MDNVIDSHYMNKTLCIATFTHLINQSFMGWMRKLPWSVIIHQPPEVREHAKFNSLLTDNEAAIKEPITLLFELWKKFVWFKRKIPYTNKKKCLNDPVPYYRYQIFQMKYFFRSQHDVAIRDVLIQSSDCDYIYIKHTNWCTSMSLCTFLFILDKSDLDWSVKEAWSGHP